MGWVHIKPRDAATAPVTIASLQDGGADRDWKLRVSLPQHLVTDLGWQARGRVTVLIDRQAGKLRLASTSVRKDSFALIANSKSGALNVRIPLVEHSGRLPRQPSQSIPHTNENGDLMLSLPDWVTPEAPATRRAQAAADDARRRIAA
jgi:hypothetical protein